MTPRQAADLRLRQAAERLQRANDELDAAEREHVVAARLVDEVELEEYKRFERQVRSAITSREPQP